MERLTDSKTHIAKVAKMLSDETRLAIVDVLLEHPASVNDLVTRLDVEQSRMSMHLAALREAGLVEAQREGRQQVYHLVNAEAVGAAVRALANVGAPTATALLLKRSKEAERQVQGNSAIRQARTCYDHLAGVAGVELLRGMEAHGWMQRNGEDVRAPYELTDSGVQALAARGVDVEAARNFIRRKFAYGCPDWTERVPHLGGSLGAAILQALIDGGWVVQNEATRTVDMVKPLSAWFEGV